MNTNYYAKTKRQYKYLTKRLNRLLQNGEWEKLSEMKQGRFKARLKTLYQKLEGAFSSPRLIKALGAAALVMGLSSTAHAQSFKAPVTNPFALVNKGILGVPSFVDLDGDGDLDMFDIGINQMSYSVTVDYYENTGSATAAVFAGASSNPFGIVNDSLSVKSTFADLDGDGDFDMLRTGFYSGTHLYYKNSGTKTAPAFDAPIANPFGLSPIIYANAPIFADLDGDGDQDLVLGDYYGDFHYFKNTGTKTAPQFTTSVTNPFGLANNGNSGYINVPVFSDLDGDGDLDLMMTEYYGDFLYYENTGTKTNPQFAAKATNPFSLSNMPYSYMAFADLDGDSDDDIFLIEEYGDYLFYENASGIGFDENELTRQLTVFPNPTKGIVNISLDDTFENAGLELTSSSGQLVLKQELETATNATLDVSHLNSGLYMLKLTADDRVGIKKLIIE